jgi:hypothetical protein
LTEKEEGKIDDAVDRFIEYDMGQLRGQEGQKALKEFRELGPEAIPGLIRGLNRAAKIESSCPAVTIAKKLAVMLRTSNDPDLLEFARENVGAGVGQSRHMGVIRDLKMLCIIRKRQVGNNPMIVRTPPRRDEKPITIGVDEPPEETRKLETKSKKELQDLAERDDDKAVAELARAANSDDRETRRLGRESLNRFLSRQDESKLKTYFNHDRAVVRATAAKVAGARRLALGSELIELLADDNSEVRSAAHQALVKLNRDTDFGPSAEADETERAVAAKKWRDWWMKQKKNLD